MIVILIRVLQLGINVDLANVVIVVAVVIDLVQIEFDFLQGIFVARSVLGI